MKRKKQICIFAVLHRHVECVRVIQKIQLFREEQEE